nr:unnamed protein product [Digitaria exilis]
MADLRRRLHRRRPSSFSLSPPVEDRAAGGESSLLLRCLRARLEERTGSSSSSKVLEEVVRERSGERESLASRACLATPSSCSSTAAGKEGRRKRERDTER